MQKTDCLASAKLNLPHTGRVELERFALLLVTIVALRVACCRGVPARGLLFGPTNRHLNWYGWLRIGH
jgi:hypothetical protein